MTHEQWTFGRSLRVETFGATGSPIVDASSVWTNGKFTGVVVDYTTQTWWPTTGPILPRQTPQVASAIEQALQDGDLTIVGSAVVSGQQTIELSAAATSSRGSYDIWVDPTTYLPVQVTETSIAGTLQTEFEWLPPTQSNLTLLNPRIPSGFAQLPLPRHRDRMAPDRTTTATRDQGLVARLKHRTTPSLRSSPDETTAPESAGYSAYPATPSPAQRFTSGRLRPGEER